MKSSGLSSPERASRPGCVHAETACDQLRFREDCCADRAAVGVQAGSDRRGIKVVQSRKFQGLFFLNGYYSGFSPLITTLVLS